MTEFISQGGYAGFVWASYGMVAALMLAEVVVLSRNRRTILARLGRLLRARGARQPDGTPNARSPSPEQ